VSRVTYVNGTDGVCNGARDLRQAVRSDWERKGFLVVNASAHRDFRIKVQRTRTMGSVGANLVYSARGAAAAAFVTKARLWDLVAGAAILDRAGRESQGTASCECPQSCLPFTERQRACLGDMGRALGRTRYAKLAGAASRSSKARR
jgi:hypothetical protein